MVYVGEIYVCLCVCVYMCVHECPRMIQYHLQPFTTLYVKAGSLPECGVHCLS